MGECGHEFSLAGDWVLNNKFHRHGRTQYNVVSYGQLLCGVRPGIIERVKKMTTCGFIGGIKAFSFT